MSSARTTSMVVLVLLTTTGCVSLAERVATHLATHDLEAIDHELVLFEADLAMFRKCLKERGGACEGTSTTPLPHTTQHAKSQSTAPAAPGTSTTLKESVAALPPGHPAQRAIAVLGDPVVSQSAAIYNHLRGYDSGGSGSISVVRRTGEDGGPESVVTMNLGINQTQAFHERLLGSLGSPWERLHQHCSALLGDHAGDQELASECRRVAFVRGYLRAYLRNSQFVEVDVQLAGAVAAVQRVGAAVERDIVALLADLDGVDTELHQLETATVARIQSAASSVGQRISDLIAQAEAPIVDRYGAGAARLFDDLEPLVRDLGQAAQLLAQDVADETVSAIASVVSNLESVLRRLAARLQSLEQEVASADQRVVQDIQREVNQANARLSNVFKVSNVGFVSRDNTFRARLPTLEVTLDPTVRSLVTVRDVDTGRMLTGASDLGDLGVATDRSGVGTGSRIGSEIARVLLEAIFDANEGLPALAPANQPSLEATGLLLGDESLPLFQSPLGHVDAGDLSVITQLNDRIAASTRVLVSRVVAGIGPFSLNNPPLEELLTEVVTTTVRKAAAKATWCWYACNLDQDLKALESDAETAAEDEAREIGQRAETALESEAERVKLRLRFGR